MKKKKKQRKKKKYELGTKEFFFNLISIILLLFLGIYFGARSLYYYSKQNAKIEKEELTLASSIIKNNEIVTSGDGLYKEKDDYIFKGKVENNYVKFGNRLFRVMEVYDNNSVKIVSNTNEAILVWGDDFEYSTSNVYNFLNKTEKAHSGIYLNTIPGYDKLLKKTTWCDAILADNKVECSKEEQKSLVNLLTLEDYVDSLGKNSYLNNGTYTFLLGHDSDNSNLIITSDGNVESVTNYEGYGVRAVLTLKKNIEITSGDGTKENPYLINQEGNDTNIGKVVKLGNDTYTIFEDTNDILKMSLNNYINDSTSEYLMQFSNKNATFDPTYRYNVAYYLNTTYYNNLSYNAYLSDCSFVVGELSNETGLDYENMYGRVINQKVGLKNLYDYNNDQNLTDYYLINTTSTIGTMGLVYNNSGMLTEEKVTEEKHIVPVVCINKNIVKSGDGTEANPYVVE